MIYSSFSAFSPLSVWIIKWFLSRFNLEATRSWVSLIPLDLWRLALFERLLSKSERPGSSHRPQKMREDQREVGLQPAPPLPVTPYAFIGGH